MAKLKYNEDCKSIPVTTGNCTLHFPSLTEAKGSDKYPDNKQFWAVLTFDKSDPDQMRTWENVLKCYRDAAKSGFPGATAAQIAEMEDAKLLDGDAYESDKGETSFSAAVAGCRYIQPNAKETKQPKAFTAPKVGGKFPAIPQAELQGSDIVRANLGCKAHPNNGGGVSIYLNSLLRIEKGEGFDGTSFDHLDDPTGADGFADEEIPL